MKHSNFYKKYKDIEAQEFRELAAALQAHGGEYVFFDCDAEDAEEKWHDKDNYDDIPSLYGGYSWMDTSERYLVTRVKRTEEGGVKIYGFRDEFGSPMDEDVIDIIEYGYIEYILDAIPETDEIHDVRELPKLEFVPVLSLSRDDVETIGFNPNLTDDELMGLGHAVSKRLENGFMEDFWISLEDACETIGYKRIKKDEDEE